MRTIDSGYDRLFTNSFSTYQSRLGLTVDQIRTESADLYRLMQHSENTTRMRLDEQSRVLTSLLDGQANVGSWLRSQRLSTPSIQLPLTEVGAPTSLRSPSHIISIKAYSSFHHRSTCVKPCRCSCHGSWGYKSPTILHWAFGTLFAGYSGYPTRIFQRCSCESPVGSHAYFYYLFPSWSLTTAITITLTRVSLVKVHTALAVRRIVPFGADIFRLSYLRDVEGLKELLRAGLASPDDSDLAGTTVLSVCKRLSYFSNSGSFLCLDLSQPVIKLLPASHDVSLSFLLSSSLDLRLIACHSGSKFGGL